MTLPNTNQDHSSHADALPTAGAQTARMQQHLQKFGNARHAPALLFALAMHHRMHRVKHDRVRVMTVREGMHHQRRCNAELTALEKVQVKRLNAIANAMETQKVSVCSNMVLLAARLFKATVLRLRHHCAVLGRLHDRRGIYFTPPDALTPVSPLMACQDVLLASTLESQLRLLRLQCWLRERYIEGLVVLGSGHNTVSCAVDQGAQLITDAHVRVPRVPRTACKRRRLPARALAILKHWLHSHMTCPYPSDKQKAALAAQCACELDQVSTWFTNARARILRRRNKQGKGLSKTMDNCPAVQRSAVPPGRHCKRKVLALASARGSTATAARKTRACVPLKSVRGQVQPRRHVVARRYQRLQRARTIANPASIESLGRQLGLMRMSATLPLPARPRAATCTVAQAVRAAMA